MNTGKMSEKLVCMRFRCVFVEVVLQFIFVRSIRFVYVCVRAHGKHIEIKNRATIDSILSSDSNNGQYQH